MFTHRVSRRSIYHPVLLALAAFISPVPSAEVAWASDQAISAHVDTAQPDTPRPDSTPEVEVKTPEQQSVQQDVDAAAVRQTDQHRRKLHEEAIAAVRMTEGALELLSEKEPRSEEALAELEKAVGKLELLVARNPKLATIPVAVESITRDVLAPLDTVEALADQAEAALEGGRVQDARRILSGLASEYVVSTTRLPLATYPDAIKAAVPLIDAGKTAEARSQLHLALNLQVVEDTIYPLPLMRAEAMLAAAEKLAEKVDRKQSENERLAKLLDAAREELKFGKALGYYEKEDATPLYDQITEIESKTDGGKSGTGFFTILKKMVTNLF